MTLELEGKKIVEDLKAKFIKLRSDSAKYMREDRKNAAYYNGGRDAFKLAVELTDKSIAEIEDWC